jgi:carotenoid cleavage dioxygenase-like enzyme
VHDIAVSSNYLVIIEAPVFIDLAAIMSLKEADLGFLAWKPDLGTRVYVVPLDGSGVSRHEDVCGAFE